MMVATGNVTIKSTVGSLAPEGPNQKGKELIGSSFDYPNREVSCLEFLPQAFDSIWTWQVKDKVVSALIARSIRLTNGDNGIILGYVATTPEHQRQGFASQLIDNLCRHYADQGATFVEMWAREYLLGLYEPLGFSVVFKEYYLGLDKGDGVHSTKGSLSFGPLDEFPHEGFDKVRIQFETNVTKATETCSVSRPFKDRKWYGVNTGFTFGPRLSLAFFGSQEAPRFYAVVGEGANSTTIIEFAGATEDFVGLVSWLATRFPGKPIKYNLTGEHLRPFSEAIDAIEKEQNFCTIHRPLLPSGSTLPLVSWLDRL